MSKKPTNARVASLLHREFEVGRPGVLRASGDEDRKVAFRHRWDTAEQTPFLVITQMPSGNLRIVAEDSNATPRIVYMPKSERGGVVMLTLEFTAAKRRRVRESG